MGTNLLRKGDPRVARFVAMHALGEETGSTYMVVPDGAAADGVELLVSLNTDDVPSQLQRQPWQWRRLAGRLFSVRVPPQDVREVYDSPSVRAWETPRPIMPMTRHALQSTRIADLHGGHSRRGSHIVVGIIDFGFDFTLEDFKDESGDTRVAYIWDQTLVKRRGERTPEDYNYGVEYKQDRIQEAIRHADPFDRVRHKPEPESHGTHVAGIAAGNGRGARKGGHSYSGAAPDATIIFVQPALGSDTAPMSVTNSARLIDAISYIFDRAKRLRMPCVINLSLGHYATGHDGETSLERAMDYHLQDPGRAIVVAAGNVGDAKTHYEWRFQSGAASADVTWRIPPDSGRTYHEIEMWYPSRAVVDVELTSPSHEKSVRVGPNDDIPVRFGDDIAFIASTRFDPFNGDSRILLTLQRDEHAPVTAGDWTIHLHAKAPEETVLHAWIERVIGPPEAQSIFVDTSSRNVTLGSPATSRYCIAVGNWSTEEGAANISSSLGPTRDGRQKPEIVAPGTNVTSCHSLAGRPGIDGNPWPATTVMSGTSMSAPLVAGLVACLFEENRQLTAPQVAKILAASSSSSGYRPDVGFGLVDAVKALSLVRNYIV